MKTKQEQIEKMTSIIVETLQDKRVENGTTFVTYLPSLFGNNMDKEKEVAEALIENGYGDVTEYKAEIERLKAENEQFRKLRILGNEATIELHDDVVSEPSADYKDIEKLKEETSNIRKDTAKEFATRICEMLWNSGVDASCNRFSYGDLTSKNVMYVAKQFGVDIDDHLCKENSIAMSHINKLIEQDAEIKKLKQQVKQAKIEVLNELKERIETAIDTYWNSNGGGYYLAEDAIGDIDDLITEVENGKETN